LYVIYYIGAAQTNRFAVKYCVPNKDAGQKLMINLTQNMIETVDKSENRQRFVAGGVQFNGGPAANALFAQTTGVGKANFEAPNSEVLNWFASMIVNPAAEGIDQFMVPFAINEIRKDVQDLAQKKQDERTKGQLEILDEAIKQANQAGIAGKLARQEKKDKEQQQQYRENAAVGRGGADFRSGDDDDEENRGNGRGNGDNSVADRRAQAESTLALAGAAGQFGRGIAQVAGAIAASQTDDPKQAARIQAAAKASGEALDSGAQFAGAATVYSNDQKARQKNQSAAQQDGAPKATNNGDSDNSANESDKENGAPDEMDLSDLGLLG
jgi:hypothetical protein